LLNKDSTFFEVLITLSVRKKLGLPFFSGDVPAEPFLLPAAYRPQPACRAGIVPAYSRDLPS